jgi:choline dehydrogenase
MTAPTLIVGAGSSGAVLANRLSASGAREIVLLEAGPDYLPEALPPDLTDGKLNSMSAHDWGYRHRPSEKRPEAPLPRGRVVGGSSAVNTCIALRGQPEDFDEWAALGLDSWRFEACLPAFRRLERDLDFGAQADVHGNDGPLPVRRHPAAELVPFQAAFVEACRELGYPDCPDSNRPGSWGVGPHAMNKLSGRRISAAEAYLTAAVRARQNLTIRPNTHVRRVLFENGRAVGVELEHDGVIGRLRASSVILCAGAIATPGILLRSGVGPTRTLARLGVAQVVDAPAVAHRLLDHPGTGIMVWAARGAVVDRTAPIVQTVLRYASGALDHRADMLLQPVSFAMLSERLPLLGLVTQVGKPRGTGEIVYDSADPHARPRIRQRFFEDAQDRRLAREALVRGARLLDTQALRRFGTPILPWRGMLKSERWLDAAVQRLCDSGYHPCGTVPMGVRPSELAATDERGKLFGLEGLYVADASLMPTVPSSNIHLPTLMMAERLAEWLGSELG